MLRSYLKSFVLAGIAMVALNGASQAGVVLVDSSVGGLPLAGTSLITFNGTPVTPPGVTLALTGSAALVTGSVSEIYSAPILTAGQAAVFGGVAGPDQTQYVTSGTGSATLTFAGPGVGIFGLLWGSVDSYNTITFTTVAGTTFSFTGNQVLAGTNGTQTVYANFATNAGDYIRSVTMSSTSNAFEFDNVTYAVPEPSSLAMGLAAAGLAFAARKFRAKRASA